MSSFVISVSAGTGCYRHIQISKSETLYRLHKAIIQAFDFDDDHEHAFFMDNKCWSRNAPFFSCKVGNANKLTKRTKLNELSLKKGDQFKYLFDFGDEWVFQCKVLREVDAPTDIPGIIRSVGESPEQYPSFEDDAFPEDFDEDIEALSDEEIDDLFSQIPLSRDTIECILMYMDAAVRLYGLVPLNKLLDIYNSQNPPVSPDLFIAVSMIADYMDTDYALLLRDDLPSETLEEKLAAYEIVGDYLLFEDPEENIRNLREMQSGKPLKILPKKQFLQFKDPCYFPATPQRSAMAKFLHRRERSLPMPAWDYCSCIQELLVIDARMQVIMDFIEEDNISFDRPGDFEEFANLLMNLNNHTHKHCNNGHTPDELFHEHTRTLPHTARKVSDAQISIFNPEFSAPAPVPATVSDAKIPRNAPCPCGSGKKYKNCCGR